MSRDVNGRLISHDHLRYFEKGFPNLVYFEGVFHSSLGEIYKRRFQHHVDGTSFRALIVGDNDERIKSNEDIYGEGYHTYLRLEDVLQEDRLYPSP
ncbi:hypothetical protein P3T76_001074 [Phytophthora citrophthora]|uniref:Uncharacterized protein n=1 Tax=Phytophthora citrophthora TaxID=4793 RepID=A0AAD9LUE0_9STRA|nr:hypothetical protein P3T76_001074 [Phytophthora citrophthora]